jgi:hypothetical protein
VENDQAEPKTGRPKSKVPKELLKLRLDPTTLRMLEELETYGRFGTTKQDIVMYVLRTWLWEHEARLVAGIASKARPLGSGADQL